MNETIRTNSAYKYIKKTHEGTPGDKIFVLEGGGGCFQAVQKVITSEGSKNISDIKTGALVLSFNTDTNKKEFRKVIETHKYRNSKPVIKVKLKNGKEIIATEDHEFYYKGSWRKLKDILILLHDDRLYKCRRY